MALRYGTCNCGNGLATEKITITVRVWGTTEERETLMCRNCKELTEANGLAVKPASTFTYETRYGIVSEPIPSDVAAAVSAAEKHLANIQRLRERALSARSALPSGSSRARVTTANANWASYAEAAIGGTNRLVALQSLAS